MRRKWNWNWPKIDIDIKSNKQEHYNSYYNCISYFQEGSGKIDILNRDVEGVKNPKSHFNNVLTHTKQHLRLKIYTRFD